MSKILYKSLPTDRSPHGYKFRLNKWNKIEGELEICENGFHASENIIHAMGYVTAGWVAKVEVRGESEIQEDKQCWSEMRIIEWHKWTKKDSVALAIFAAELCIKEFEKACPKDDRPRKAIEAARAVLENDTAKNRSAARSAAESAAESARSAAKSAAWSAKFAAESAAKSAAESAAWSAAESAAWSAARSAARSAAESAAWSAAESARSAAKSAAWSAKFAAESAAVKKIYQECHDFVIERKFKNEI